MPISLFGKDTYVGIDIGSHTIKAAQVEQKSGIWRVTRAQYTNTPTETVVDGVVVDPETVGNAIRKLMSSGRFNATAANVAVAGASVIVRSVRLPKMNEATVRKSIKFEAGRYVPTSVEDSYIEFEILGPSTVEGQMEVLIVAAPRDVVESRVKACAMAGLDTEVVDVEAFALYRALVESVGKAQAADTTIALVDIGGSNTHVSVAANGLFALTRSIPIAGDTFTQALKSYLKCTDEEAEKIKRELDFTPLAQSKAGPMENPPLRLLQPIVDELLREIRRSLNYYQSQLPEGVSASPVSSVLATGGTMHMKGLAEYLAYRLSIPVTRADVFTVPSFDPSAVGELLNDGSGMRFCVAVGLAMRRSASVAVAA
ncbi:MAG: type IV pilus assembly protein PilM [bacterium]|jgi:type IV pilus assembly protein PilM